MTFLASILRLLKGHKKSVAGSVALSLLAAVGAAFFDVGEKEIKHALFQEQEIARPLEVEVNQLRTNTIKRQDFGQYIQRKDDEYHTQMTTNQGAIKSIAELQGEMHADDATRQKDEAAQRKDDALIQEILHNLGELQGQMKEADEVLGRIAGKKNDP